MSGIERHAETGFARTLFCNSEVSPLGCERILKRKANIDPSYGRYWSSIGNPYQVYRSDIEESANEVSQS